jgi:hypothetical protein
MENIKKFSTNELSVGTTSWSDEYDDVSKTWKHWRRAAGGGRRRVTLGVSRFWGLEILGCRDFGV